VERIREELTNKRLADRIERMLAEPNRAAGE
jgi:hypothetical protein